MIKDHKILSDFERQIYRLIIISTCIQPLRTKTNMLLTYIGPKLIPFYLIGYGNLHRMYNESCQNVDHYLDAIGADSLHIHPVGK